MATVASDSSSAPPARGYRADQAFFSRFAIALAATIVLGFAQFALQGIVDYRAAPLRVHLHGAVMLAWLALFVVQNRLAETGNVVVHRQLGRVGGVLALLVAVTAAWVAIGAIAEGRRPPFFPAPYFLALTLLGVASYLALVGWAVVRRRQTEWHRRLMLASLISLLEPAFGRILPLPLIMPWGEAVVLAIQLAAFAVLVRHDRKVLGRVHPATIAGALVVTAYHLAIEVLGRTGPFVGWAERLVSG